MVYYFIVTKHCIPNLELETPNVSAMSVRGILNYMEQLRRNVCDFLKILILVHNVVDHDKDSSYD